MYSFVLVVLETMEDEINYPQSVEASVLLATIQSFDFIFNMNMMMKRKEHDILNAMRLVQVAK